MGKQVMKELHKFSFDETPLVLFTSIPKIYFCLQWSFFVVFQDSVESKSIANTSAETCENVRTRGALVAF